jgi:hypothetical protein
LGSPATARHSQRKLATRRGAGGSPNRLSSTLSSDDVQVVGQHHIAITVSPPVIDGVLPVLPVEQRVKEHGSLRARPSADLSDEFVRSRAESAARPTQAQCENLQALGYVDATPSAGPVPPGS